MCIPSQHIDFNLARTQRRSYRKTQKPPAPKQTHQMVLRSARYGHWYRSTTCKPRSHRLPITRKYEVCMQQLPQISIRTFSSSTSPISPSFAPKPIVATKPIRENPDFYSQNCLNRNLPLESTYPIRIKKLSDILFELRSSLNLMRGKQNVLGAKIKAAALRRNEKPEEWEDLQAQAKVLKRQISTQEAVEQQLEDEMNMLAAQLPNLTHPDTPIQGKLNVIEYINKGRLPAPSSQTLPKTTEKQIPELLYRGAPGISHVEIGTELGILDFSSSSKTSGWGWYFLHGDAVLLEQALIQYSLACARSKGWNLVSPPSIVYTHIAGACGFKPRDNNNEQQIYHISQGSAFEGSQDSSRPELCLAGTAEIPLAGMFANTALPKAKFPKKMVGVSRCYRAEAGSHGLATKGLYRVHEFTKVELFAWTLPDPDLSDQTFNEILDLQRDIITSLEIPARVISMPSDDLGAPAYRKYDIEAFMPSRKGEKYGGWGEVTSVSECTDYQARRLNARCKYPDGKLGFLWSLNGTALAVPRIITAILENNWDGAKREVRIPKVLRPYMGGLELIKNSESAP
ncbi:Serine--tRNA ligase, mitochondrial [Orbilia oligospora]|uniref:Serine--tRNA ligase, mitochondrial n=1 Tax=Orbilia oligospora TaxID=2813651 RepID=A0A7C8TU33_ORBOL|nr:Serine--tRNA ligase, mitochondrial [Orbilia oligospora]KAF3181013.1 Serine--tRNA ligase, mitochondrial [Orbilia oligospora]KAF3232135.1 Serine--tRNA ligase, mitochondrial [Orbilia oligospora]KAF3266618.1 Serine--tRNA ligase, mitochondrial [Orbilia oligospora]KAF3285707.1 Serine--tRNA ligase, mitochondrial [Orbilia oligospora]